MKNFLIDLIERAVKTAAQTAVASIGTTHLLGGIDWKMVGSTVGIAVILSVLTSLASHNFGDKGTASVVNTPTGNDGNGTVIPSAVNTPTGNDGDGTVIPSAVNTPTGNDGDGTVTSSTVNTPTGNDGNGTVTSNTPTGNE
ncbi:MAG: holin [Oscillospiraceae bacterium]|nr:holin [Oscillospiraceae bacterium]